MVTPTQARLPFCLVLLLKVLQMKKATFWGSLIFQKLKYELNWCYSANVTAAIYPVSLIRVVAHGNADTGEIALCLVLLLKVLQMKKATFWGSLIFQKLKYELNWCYSANVTAAIYPVSLIRVVAHGNADTGEIALCLVLLLKVLQMKKATFWGSLIFQKLKYELNWCDSAIVTAAWREQSRGSYRNY